MWCVFARVYYFDISDIFAREIIVIDLYFNI